MTHLYSGPMLLSIMQCHYISSSFLSSQMCVIEVHTHFTSALNLQSKTFDLVKYYTIWYDDEVLRAFSLRISCMHSRENEKAAGFIQLKWNSISNLSNILEQCTNFNFNCIKLMKCSILEITIDMNLLIEWTCFLEPNEQTKNK